MTGSVTYTVTGAEEVRHIQASVTVCVRTLPVIIRLPGQILWLTEWSYPCWGLQQSLYPQLDKWLTLSCDSQLHCHLWERKIRYTEAGIPCLSVLSQCYELKASRRPRSLCMVISRSCSSPSHRVSTCAFGAPGARGLNPLPYKPALALHPCRCQLEAKEASI